MYNEIEKKVFNLLNFEKEIKITTTFYEGVSVNYDGKKAIIGCNTKPQFARGCFLLVKHIRQGEEKFFIDQKPSFKSCGPMLDVSRNGVLKVESVKKIIDYVQTLGMNMLMLYTEDVFEMKEYPYFGYLRGRYSEKELRDIDDYAFEAGIEVIPCIQTLGHMEQYLRWAAASPVKDTKRELLAGSPETYDFIECEIKTMKKCFRSHKIHIGMDEASSAGSGKYLLKNGFTPKFELLNNHVKKVIGICEKYDFEPMMWSDMYFRICSERHGYHDETVNISKENAGKIPHIDLIYWDYDNTWDFLINHMIKEHKKISKSLVFAGGINTWEGFIPNAEKTIETSMKALALCAKEKAETVIATLWCDDGCETNHFLALPLLPVFSEACYLGEACSISDIKSAAVCLTGFDLDYLTSISRVHSKYLYGRMLFYGDIFFDLPHYGDDNTEYRKNLKEAEKAAESMKDAGEDYEYYYTYIKILVKRLEIRMNLRNKYLQKDKNYLLLVADKELPDLICDYRRLFEIQKAQWFRVYKPYGFEVLAERYGGVERRIETAAELIKRYVSGEIDKIDMLEEEPLETGVIRFHRMGISPGVVEWS